MAFQACNQSGCMVRCAEASPLINGEVVLEQKTHPLLLLRIPSLGWLAANSNATQLAGLAPIPPIWFSALPLA